MPYREQIDKSRIPAHVAIIMDGNGRWAKQRGQARSFGHQAGAETVHIIAEEAARLGVKYLTLYTFSTENWNRPVDEVAALMSLLMDSIEEETFMKNNISFRIIGDTAKLPVEVLERLNQCIERTSINTGMCLTLALSYSSKWEITEAVRQIAAKIQNDKLPERSTTKATPILAPELMPSTDGPAKGLRKTVCICKPLTESPAPATNAVSACGTRDFQIIFCQITDSFPVPQRIFHTARSGMETEPNTRFRKKNRKIEAIISSI